MFTNTAHYAASYPCVVHVEWDGAARRLQLGGQAAAVGRWLGGWVCRTVAKLQLFTSRPPSQHASPPCPLRPAPLAQAASCGCTHGPPTPWCSPATATSSCAPPTSKRRCASALAPPSTSTSCPPTGAGGAPGGSGLYACGVCCWRRCPPAAGSGAGGSTGGHGQPSPARPPRPPRTPPLPLPLQPGAHHAGPVRPGQGVQRRPPRLPGAAGVRVSRPAVVQLLLLPAPMQRAGGPWAVHWGRSWR